MCHWKLALILFPAAIVFFVGEGVVDPSRADMAAHAQTSRDTAWKFPARDRAGLAVAMKQVENGLLDKNNGGGGSGINAGGFVNVDNSVTQLVCGGGSDGGGKASSSGSSATSNSSCVILSNASGQLGLGQTSAGSQTATSSSQSNLSGALEGLGK